MTCMTIERFRQLHEEWKQTKRPALLQEHRPVLPNLSLRSSSLQPPILVCQKMGLTWDSLGTYLGLTWDSHPSASGRNRECYSL